MERKNQLSILFNRFGYVIKKEVVDCGRDGFQFYLIDSAIGWSYEYTRKREELSILFNRFGFSNTRVAPEEAPYFQFYLIDSLGGVGGLTGGVVAFNSI